tara:strand:- start:1032 stop:1322 length:291 start_codon:yes stop_codon:yes gene_type:complete
MQRRQFLSFFPAAAASTIVVSSAPAIAAGVYTLHDYYAFLWLEMSRLESFMEIAHFDRRSLETGRPAADRFIASTTLPDRLNALGGTPLCPSTTGG